MNLKSQTKQRDVLQESLLYVAKLYIEMYFEKTVTDIQLEDGSGRAFLVETDEHPGKKYFIRL
jgi:hypothetical protein